MIKKSKVRTKTIGLCIKIQEYKNTSDLEKQPNVI